jgi:hypothetical protein
MQTTSDEWHQVILDTFLNHVDSGPNSLFDRMEVLRFRFPSLIIKYPFLSGKNAPKNGITINLARVRHGLKELKSGQLVPRDWGSYDELRLRQFKSFFRVTFSEGGLINSFNKHLVS